MAEREDDISTEVPSYFLSALGSWVANTAIPAATNFATQTVPNFITQTIPNAIGEVAKGGLSGLYTGADKLLGGVLPGGQAFGQGYLGQLYTGADKMLGGYLPNIGGGVPGGGAGYTPQFMQAQSAFNALPGPGSNGLRAGQVGTSFNGGPMSVGNINTPLASGMGGGMTGWDKLAMGIQGAGLLGTIFSGNKGQAQQAAMMMPGQLQPGAGQGSPMAQAIAQDPVMNTGVGVGSSQGQGKNQTPGLEQVKAGVSEKELLGEIESTRKDIEELMANMKGFDGQAFSPLESARKNSGLGMDTAGKSYFSTSGSF